MANTGNTQQQINYGAAANDGQGDPLRTAFIKTDDNFDAIWNTGPVGSNITILNNTVQSNNTNGNIIIRPNGVGIIQANASILPNTANLRDLGSTGQRWRAAYIGSGGLSVDGNVTVTGNLTAGNISYTGNVFVGDLQGSVYADDSTIMLDAVDNAMFADSATFALANITGNVTANYFIGNGSQLTGITSSYGNANVVANLAALGNNPISTTGNVTANYFVGNGSLLTGITSYANANVLALGEAGWSGNIIPSANAVYSLGNSTNYWSNLWVANNTIYIGGVPLGITAGNVLTVGGNAVLTTGSNTTVSTTGNITANYFFGNGSQLTGLPAGYSDSNVSAFLAAFGSNTIVTTGNATVGNLATGNGDSLILGNTSSRIRQNGSNATMALSGSVTLTPDTSASALNGVVIGGSGYLLAPNGSRNAELNYGGGSGTMGIYTINIYGNTTTAITNGGANGVGNIGANASNRFNTAFLTAVNASGNVTADYFFGNGSQLTGTIPLANIATYVNIANVQGGSSSSYKIPFTALESGGITQFEIDDIGPGLAYSPANGTVTCGNLRVSGNITAGDNSNISTISANVFVATGNITANYFFGNGSQITDVNAVTVDVTDTNGLTTIYYPTFVENRTTAQIARADVDLTYRTDDNLLTVGNVSVTGNITANSFIGNISVTGNVTGTTANVTLIAGSYSTVFDNTGNTTFANGTVSLTNLSATGNITGNTAGFAIGYRDIPQVAFTGNTTLAATDAGKHYYSTLNTGNTLTIANNTSVSWSVGTAITVVNRGTGNITVAQGTGVSLYLAGNNTAGNRTVTTYGMATLLNVAANVWMINGTGVS